jgi:hypothetical protein
MMVPKKSLFTAFATVAIASMASAQVQTEDARPIKKVATTRYGTVDLSTGRTETSSVPVKRATGVFCYVNTDTAGGFGSPSEMNIETIIDWGIMGGTATTQCSGLSDIVTNFNFAYATSSVDTSVAGPGAAMTLSFYNNYAGFGVDSGNAPVATYAFTGLPAFSGASTGIGSGYFFTVDLTGGFEICIPDGSFGFGYASPEASLDMNGFANSGPIMCFTGGAGGAGQEAATGNWDGVDSWLPDTTGVWSGNFWFGGAPANFTSFYSAVAKADFSGSPATVGFRNAGSNVANYTGSPMVLGGTFTAAVDLSLTGQVLGALFAFDTPFTFTLAAGQTVLALDLGGSGELFSGSGLPLAGPAFGTVTGSLPLPKNVNFCGLTLFSQALQFGVPPFELSNSQDLAVGG